MRCRDHLRFALTSPADSASSLSNGCTSNCATTASTNTGLLISIGVCGNDIGSLKHNSGAQRDHVAAPLLAIRQKAGRGLSDL
jgi:hypothetical protein